MKNIWDKYKMLLCFEKNLKKFRKLFEKFESF